MPKKRRGLLGLILFIALACSGVSCASGVVIFQIEVIPGFTISCPDNLVFEAVAPGQAVERELTLTLWSNAAWELLVTAAEGPAEEGLRGELEYCDSWGFWEMLDDTNKLVSDSETPTGPEGSEVRIPFRFTGSYEDAPGSYSLGIEFTVVPII